MDVFRRCSIRLAIRVSVECISPSLAEQWRADASSLGGDPRPVYAEASKRTEFLPNSNEDNTNHNDEDNNNSNNNNNNNKGEWKMYDISSKLHNRLYILK